MEFKKMKDEIYNMVSELLNEEILNGFYSKKGDFKAKNFHLNDFIYQDAYNEKFPDIITYKVLSGTGDICGFYALFYSFNYIKYILNGRDIFYLYVNSRRKSLFKFYLKFKDFLIKNMPTLEDFEIKELNKGSSLERNQLDFIMENNLLLKYMKKYNSLMEKSNYIFDFEWFDFIEDNFSISEIPKIKKLNSIFNQIIECSKQEFSNPPKIFFFFIGLTEHWILIIYDSMYKDKFIEMDSYYGIKDIVNLKYLNQKCINDYVDYINKDIIKVEKRYLTEFQIRNFKNTIEDTQRCLYKLNLILNHKNKFSFAEFLLERKCDAYVQTFMSLKYDKNDKLNELLGIYDFFLNKYNPEWIKEDFFSIMKEFGIKYETCTNDKIKQFLELIKKIREILKQNINLIEQEEIKSMLEKGLNSFNEIDCI